MCLCSRPNPALRELLNSAEFWAPNSRAAMVKSPVDLVVGTIRQLEIEPVDPMALAFTMAGLGQNLFAPPNVKGWPGGTKWINSSTLLARKQFVERVFDAPMPARGNAAAGGAAKGVGRLQAEARERVAKSFATLRFDDEKWLAQFPVAAQGDGDTVRRYL